MTESKPSKATLVVADNPRPPSPQSTVQTPLQAEAMAHVQARFIIAQARPRSVEQARVELLRECESFTFAESARYALERGNQTISDFSIRFAEAASRVWQNMNTDVQVVLDTPEVRVLRVSVVDLEANNGWGGEVTVEKKVMRKKRPADNPAPALFNFRGEPLYAVPASEEEMTIKTNAQVSKAARSYILRHLPVWLKEECTEAIQATVKRGVESSKTQVLRKLVASYEEQGVQPRQLEAYVGHALAQSSVKEVETLRGLWVGIRDGQTTWAEAMATRGAPLTTGSGGPSEGAQSPEEPQDAPGNRTQELGAMLKKGRRRRG